MSRWAAEARRRAKMAPEAIAMGEEKGAPAPRGAGAPFSSPMAIASGAILARRRASAAHLDTTDPDGSPRALAISRVGLPRPSSLSASALVSSG